MKKKVSIKYKKFLSLYSIAHLMVDWICVGGVLLLDDMNQLDGGSVFFYILLYNLLAFASQPFIGFYVDEKGKGTLVGTIGIFLLISGLLFIKIPIILVLMLGIGNGMFHISGGVFSLYYDEGRAKAAGLFVAPGAIGVFLGSVVTSNILVLYGVSFILVLVAAYLQKLNVHGELQEKITAANTSRLIQGNGNIFYLVVLALFTVIAFRGIIGGGLFLKWNTSISFKILVLTMIVSGKALGGILGDRFGFLKIGVGGLILAIPLLTLTSDIWYLACVGIFVFNLTMPITLTVLATIFNKYKGFAFGLTTLALVIGYIVDIMRGSLHVSGMIVVPVGVLISIACLYFAIKEVDREDDVLSESVFVEPFN